MIPPMKRSTDLDAFLCLSYMVFFIGAVSVVPPDVPQKDLNDELRETFLSATTAGEVYRTMEQHSTALMELTMARCNISKDSANALLMGQVAVPTRKNKDTPSCDEGVSGAQFCPRGLRAAPGSPRRTIHEVTASGAAYLLHGDRFIHESFGHLGLVDAMAAVFMLMKDGAKIVEHSVPQQSVSVVTCLLAYFALIATKVCEHLKLRCGDGSAPAAGDGGFN